VGNYSEYGSNAGVSFLRGRQTTDINGQVSFISIFPGWYPGRAPHIHVEVLDATGDSIRVTQIAFPKDICDTVYVTDGYNGVADTSNQGDGIFANSLAGNMADSVAGNTMDGYTLLKTLVV
jgi:protocatechuate 3,4-dioxygenase beta subunit